MTQAIKAVRRQTNEARRKFIDASGLSLRHRAHRNFAEIHAGKNKTVAAIIKSPDFLRKML